MFVITIVINNVYSCIKPDYNEDSFHPNDTRVNTMQEPDVTMYVQIYM